MTKVALQIPDDLQPFIERAVKSGMFSDAADFMLDLLYNVKSQSEALSAAEFSQKLERLRGAVNVGMQQLRDGDYAEFDADDIIKRGRARLAAKA